MKVRRLVIRLGLLVLLLGAVVQFMMAEVNCYDIDNCTYCDFWNGNSYAGYMRWCRHSD